MKKQTARMRTARDNAVRAWEGPVSNGMSRWEFDHEPASGQTARISPIVTQWERENRPVWQRIADRVGHQMRRHARGLAIGGFTFILGVAVASGPQSATANMQLRDRLRSTHNTLSAREGELELTRLELSRLNTVMENSQRYRIPADIAAKIYDIALAEGIEPTVAFGLVNIESDFKHNAVSPKGALGFTQLMPATARFFEPNIERADLFDPETNLRIGFRFLKELIAKYDGDVQLALHAYNRGPTVVDRVVRKGGDPANGYAAAVMKKAN